MNKCVLLSFLTSLTVSALRADSPNGGNAPSAEIPGGAGVLKPTEAQADFDVMRATLEEAHPGLYRYSTKAEMDRIFDAQQAKLDHSLSKRDFMTVVSETVAVIRCGHTEVEPDGETRKEEANARLFPLRVMAEEKRLMVLFNDTPANETIRPGMEVLEINGHKSADILARIRRTQFADGDIETGKNMKIPDRFALYYWRLIEPTGDFTVMAKDGTDKPVIAKLPGVTGAERKMNHNPVNATILANINKLNGSPENASLRFLKDPEIAEIRLRWFVGDDFPAWTEKTFKLLSEKGTKTLILDLRGNGGGEDEYGALLVSYLRDKPFRYFDHICAKAGATSPFFKAHTSRTADQDRQLSEGVVPNPLGGYLLKPAVSPGLAEQSPAKYPFRGKVFVLIDGGTFSTAADFSAVVQHLKRATFIGEETGGGHFGNNSGPADKVTLPNSKLVVWLQLWEYWNAVQGDDNNRRGTIPNYVIKTRISDLLQGVDRPLDQALKLADTSTASN